MLDPFENPKLIPALNLDTQEAFWLGYVGQGCQDAKPMSEQDRLEFARRITTSELQPLERRYVYAISQHLTLYRHEE